LDGIYYAINSSQSLYHHGVKGMRWGHRRYQNEDGSLTPAGREHYKHQIVSNTKVHSRETKNAAKAIAGAVYGAELAVGAKTLAQVTAMSVAHIAAMSNPVTAIGMNAVAMATGLGLGYAARYGIARAGQKAYMKAARNQGIKQLAKDNVKKDPSKNYKDERKRLKYKANAMVKGSKGFKLPKDPNPSVPKSQRHYSSSGNKKIEDKLYNHGYRPIEEGSSYFGKYSHTGHGYYVDSTYGDRYVKDYIKSANKTYKDENRWARKNYKK
jgi:hypothetical protein